MHDDISGIFLLNASQRAQHDVGSLVGRTATLYANEALQRSWLSHRLFRRNFDRKGYVGHLPLCFRTMRLIAGPIFIESGNDAIKVLHHPAVQLSFRPIEPVAYECLVFRPTPHLIAEVEVRIAECLAVEPGLHPIMIHAEGSHEHFTVVSSQKAIEGPQMLSPQFQKHRVDDLNDIEISESEELADRLHQPFQRFCLTHARTSEVDVARIVLPSIAV